MKKAIITFICLASAARVFAASALTDEKSTNSYAVGMSMALSVKSAGLDLDNALFIRGYEDAMSGGQTLVSTQDLRAIMMEVQKTARANQMKRAEEMAAKNKLDGEAFLAANKKNPGVETLPDGLQYQVISGGTGALPTATDTVTVNYEGTLIDGTVFDSSYKRGQPATFPVSGVIHGWTEALQKMPVGSKWKLFIPSDLAYGPQGNRSIPGNSVLVFTVELLSIKEAEKPAAPQPPAQPLTSDIIKVPSADEMKKGAKIQVIKADDAAKMQQTNQ